MRWQDALRAMHKVCVVVFCLSWFLRFLEVNSRQNLSLDLVHFFFIFHVVFEKRTARRLLRMPGTLAPGRGWGDGYVLFLRGLWCRVVLCRGRDRVLACYSDHRTSLTVRLSTYNGKSFFLRFQHSTKKRENEKTTATLEPRSAW